MSEEFYSFTPRQQQPGQQAAERSPKKEKSMVSKSIYEFIDNESLEISLGRVTAMDRIVTMTSQMLLKVILRRNCWNGVPQSLVEEVRKCGDVIQRRNPLHFEIGNTVLRMLRFIRRAAEEVYTEQLQKQQQQQQQHDEDHKVSESPVNSLHPRSESGSQFTPSPRAVSISPVAVSPDPGTSLSYSTLDLDSRALMSASRVLAEDLNARPFMTKPFDKAMRAKVRDLISTSCQDLEGEIETVLDEIGRVAREHVHPNECILVYGYSSTVARFLISAHQRGVKFEVLVADSAPRCDGQEMTVELVKAGITTTLIPDSALFVMMPRVNKVIVGANAIMSNGGVITASGVHLLALVARKHGVPVTVCSSLFKLTPRYPYDLEFLSCLANPAEVLPHVMLPHPDQVGVLNPRFDYVPPELVSLFITDHGCHTPSFIYRLLEEYYDAEDYQFNPILATAPIVPASSSTSLSSID